MTDNLRERLVGAVLPHLPRDQFTPVAARAFAARLADIAVSVRDADPEYWRERAEKAERQLQAAENGIAHLERRIAYLEGRCGTAEAVIARVRDLHRVHRCAVDGHKLATTRSPCVNDSVCSCGQRGDRCPTLAALDDTPAEEDGPHVEP